jgi:hypothetical protein
MAEWTPFETHCYSENLATPGIELGTSGSAARKSDHQTTEAVNPKWHSAKIYNISKIGMFHGGDKEECRLLGC